ncbi:MAG: hypothetical protein JWR80_9909 [Bradyrhizobium sp.]|nr:hypothetical protein [Bradyrhizobium sp.]
MTPSEDHLDQAAEPETEAAVWLARLHADDKSANDERAFRRWLDADPVNRQAFDHLTEVWEATGATVRNPYDLPPPRRFNIRRRELLMATGAVVIAGGGLGYWNAAVAGVYETQIGEQKHVSLEDGSLLFLDTETKVRVRYSGTSRHVSLYRGRCNFRVAPDRTRPFVVEAGSRQIVAPRATFDVRRDGEKVSVVCITGSATVEPLDSTKASAATGKLAAGERLVATPGESAQIDAPDLNAAVSWQSGQLIFNDETLGSAVEEMNRYSPSKLVVTDPRAAALRVSGVYRVGDNSSFARSVAQLLPLRVTENAGSIELARAS